MRLMDFICTDAIRPTLDATTARAAVAEMVDALVGAGALDGDDRRKFLDAVMRREKKGTTGFGEGVAIPHAKHEAIRGIVGTVARSPDGVDFGALDGQPVHLFFLILSNTDLPEEHLKAMEHVLRCVKNDNLRRFMCQATTREELVDLVREADEELDLRPS
jgi:PTS system fructose-specific IIA component/PTS system nitrogen regulatory IIA component